MAFEEMGKPKLLKMTPKLAQTYRDMKALPRERPFGESRAAGIRTAILAGEFRGSELASALCHETDTIYRVNGQHTSTEFCKLFEEGFEPDVTMVVREYDCPTLEDVARLYGTFDTRSSVRTRAHQIRMYGSASPQLEYVPDHTLSVAASGLAYNLWEDAMKHRSIEDHAMLMLQHSDFVAWASELLGSRSGHCKSRHMFRVACIAAMARTYFKVKGASTEFWTMIRDDSEGPVDSPPRKLYRWLLTHTMHSARGKKSSVITTSRETMAKCIHAWNAWRKGEGTNLMYRPDKPLPQAV